MQKFDSLSFFASARAFSSKNEGSSGMTAFILGTSKTVRTLFVYVLIILYLEVYDFKSLLPVKLVVYVRTSFKREGRT